MKHLCLAAMLAFAAPAMAAETPAPQPPADGKPFQYDGLSPPSLRIFVKPGPCTLSGTAIVCGASKVDSAAPAPQPEAKPEPKPKPGIG